VTLTAYNPSSPTSGGQLHPGAVFLFELKTARRPVSATVLFNMHNCVDGDFTNYNEFVERDGVRGINMASEKKKPNRPVGVNGDVHPARGRYLHAGVGAGAGSRTC